MDTTASSPPSTPVRTSLVMSPIDTGSPVHSPSYRQHLRRRTSSFSSNHDRSPVSIRSRHRFSNASQYSDNFSPDGDGGGGGVGMGNLADELDELDDEEYDEEGEDDATLGKGMGKEPSPVDGARDSGIDVSYSSTSSSKASPRSKNFSKPFCTLDEDRAAEEEEEEQEDRLSPELEEAMSSIARMASTTPTTNEDPLFPRVAALLQDLGNQSALEAGAQRLTTSTNSMTAHLAAQSKALHTLATSLYPPFLPAFSEPIDPHLPDDAVPLLQTLLATLPHLPDAAPAPLAGLRRLDRETQDVVRTLSHLTDTLQMGKHTTNAAARHLRTTQQMVADLRRERERAEAAQLALEEVEQEDREGRFRGGWCKAQCEDVVEGFERRCEELRGRIVDGWA